MMIIGQRIRELRTERMPALTQEALAERAGVSVDVIRKLEQGRKVSARLPTLASIAEALDVDLSALVGRPRYLESVPADGGLLALRRALTPVSDPAGEPLSLDLPAELAEAWDCYWTGEYDRATAILSPLLDAARTTRNADVLADGMRCAASLLVHLGHDDLALFAIMKAAEVVTEPLLQSAVQGTRAWVLMNQARPGDAATVAVKEADRIEPRRRARNDQIVVWGGLLVTAATAFARAGDDDQAQSLLRDAHGAAVKLGKPSTAFNQPFGEAQTVMQSVDVAVVAGNHVAALERAGRMPAGLPGLPLAARARHMTDVAASHTALGQVDRAEEILLKVERDAPRWMRYQVFPKAVVAELAVGRRPSPRIRQLARRLGVAT
jgi:transcriptional regulator with XRE-family HTH domain